MHPSFCMWYLVRLVLCGAINLFSVFDIVQILGSSWRLCWWCWTFCIALALCEILAQGSIFCSNVNFHFLFKCELPILLPSKAINPLPVMCKSNNLCKQVTLLIVLRKLEVIFYAWSPENNLRSVNYFYKLCNSKQKFGSVSQIFLLLWNLGTSGY